MSRFFVTYVVLPIISTQALVDYFGFSTSGPGRQPGSTGSDITMTLYWDQEIIQCTVSPTSFSTWYYCYPGAFSSTVIDRQIFLQGRAGNEAIKLLLFTGLLSFCPARLQMFYQRKSL